ncbi:MFS transporter (plasmid) [Azospirillum oryzae]|uniref:MFS transporter n=1 Tax=Azospirillum oryzae TaxID=286727 RepID=A0A6N1ASL0_9PROT|nr:MFS transporter [Azospirillum oryzae]KAA0584878.1 MFS transporter [Azospirillum oryzae]QKS54359.1 MFS transporter [Azospirillum oryzae]GLR78938.1 MFS transporter [Azospirillum oryzae]
MPMVVRSVASLLLGVAFLMLGNGALSTLIGLRLAATDSGTTAVGMITAAYYAGLTLGSLYAHRIITRVGHIRSFAAFASIVSVAALSHALFVDASLWAVLRLTQGFCMAGLYMCIESWLNGTATNESRGQLLSAYMVTLYGASGVGQQLLRLDDESGIRLFMVVSILLTLALVPVALTRTTPPQLPDVSSFGIRRLYQSSPLGVAGVFISGAITGSIYGLAPVFGAASDFGVSGTALFMSVLILGGMALQWPLGRLSDRFDRRSVIIGLTATLSLISVCMIAAAGMNQHLALMLVAPLFGGLSFTIYPICAAHTNDYVRREDMVSASGGLILSNSVGAIIGPPLASTLMTTTGPAGLFAFIGGGALCATIYGLWRSRVRPPLPAEEQAAFRPLPQTTPTVSPLDPMGPLKSSSED